MRESFQNLKRVMLCKHGQFVRYIFRLPHLKLMCMNVAGYWRSDTFFLWRHDLPERVKSYSMCCIDMGQSRKERKPALRIGRVSLSADSRFYQPWASFVSIGARSMQWTKLLVKRTPSSVESIDECVPSHFHDHVILMLTNETLTFLILVNG